MIPYRMTDTNITFFVKGRPFAVANTNPFFTQIKTALLLPDPDVDQLITWSSIREGIKTSSKGRIIIDGDRVFMNGMELHNIWVYKMLGLMAENLPFDPILRALESLAENPSATARERLPIWMEQSQLGFLPDGRIMAYKVVRKNFRDCHSGTFDNSPGSICKIDREAVDPDPDHECSSGLHLGAYSYLPSYGLRSSQNTVVLCAFWPRDVVAVPRDYNGQKMRVCEYEVLQEMNKAELVEFMKTNQLISQDWDLVEDTDTDGDGHFSSDAYYEDEDDLDTDFDADGNFIGDEDVEDQQETHIDDVVASLTSAVESLKKFKLVRKTS